LSFAYSDDTHAGVPAVRPGWINLGSSTVRPDRSRRSCPARCRSPGWYQAGQ